MTTENRTDKSATHGMRAVVADLAGSRIREVANEGMGREDVLRFWFGESDQVTPDFVREAAIASLQAGDTFYAHNLGLPELREAIAAYTDRLHAGHGTAHWLDRVAVTSGGVNGLMLASQALVDAGDEVVVVTPAWPNLAAQPAIMGAQVRCVPLRVHNGAWTLDLDALLAAITPRTRLLIVNAPNNPTGWTLSAGEQRAILAHCRRTGTWVLADEVYERLYYADDTPNGAASSFLDVAEPDDRLVVAHSFSKSFLMTGWRLGWLVLPATLTEAVGKLIEFNTSCAPVFVQRAAQLALARGDEITPGLVAHLRTCRDTLVPLLQALPGVELALPQGGMYAFFRLAGHGDCLDVAKRLVREAGLGLAPGSAFGPEATGWLRWCFASREPQRLIDGVDRLKRWLAGQARL
jgi:aspartate/methionine/tyrosine aminotransferase